MRLVIILMLIIKSLWVCGQNIEKTYALANSLYDNKSYELAVEAYKRVLFFDSVGRFRKAIYPNIADCLFKSKEYVEAANYFELAYFGTEDSVLKNQYILKKVSSYLILQQIDFAEVEILNLSNKLTKEQLKEKTTFEGIISFAKNDFSNSEKLFKTLIPDTMKVDQLFRKNEKVSRINPKKAKILSMIMPGLGQLYVGDLKNGLNSFILTGGLMFLGIRSALINTPLEAAIATLPWVQRYYQGGFNKAELIANAKIQEKRFKIYNQLLDELGNQQL